MQIFAVSGNSMAPTLIGSARQIVCSHCEHPLTVDADSIPTDSMPAPNSTLACLHCGKRFMPSDFENASALPADVVTVTTIDPRQLSRGELVAVTWEDQQHVKRLVGLPGDTVSLDPASDDRPRILINGQRVEDLLAPTQSPRVDVSSDLMRWHSLALPSSWLRSTSNHWSSKNALDIRESEWIVYRHQDPHNAGRDGPVLDDYPMNTSVRRKLSPVDRLWLDASFRSDFALNVQVAFWTPEGHRLHESHLPASSSGFTTLTACVWDAAASENQPVSANLPIAIRIAGDTETSDTETSEVTIEGLSVSRSVEYRLNRHHDRSRYPFTLSENECFVLGDNVPISVDSRTVGPIHLRSIQGTCHPLALTE
ncbi:S26 family signal peptidase [Stieleria varia]|uniref:S26 family signal peptidase n=1 Tax=Stieleria varia TaxID=2528005 RepID=UPI0011B60070